MISNASFQYWYNTKPNHLLYKDTENTNISWERKLHQLFHLYIQPTRNLFSQQRATTEAKMIKYLREPQQKWRWKQFQKKEEWEDSHPWTIFSSFSNIQRLSVCWKRLQDITVFWTTYACTWQNQFLSSSQSQRLHFIIHQMLLFKKKNTEGWKNVHI